MSVRHPGQSNPRLRQALRKAGAAGHDASAVFRLKGKGPSATLSPANTERLAQDLVHRAATHCGHHPTRLNILRNLASFVVQADAEFLAHLARQPEVAAVIPNRPAQAGRKPPRPIKKAPANPRGRINREEPSR